MLVDVHTHILPGIDDGARDVQMSEEMLSVLQMDGVTDVILTPHFYLRNQSMETFLECRHAAFRQLMSYYMGDVRLHLGAEVAFSNLAIDYEQLRCLGIDGGRHILLELPYAADLEKQILPKLEQFICQTGMQPILAHVERYQGLQTRPGLARDLIDMGCLLQVNAEAVLESRRGSLVDALLTHGQAHLLGSDCHNTTTRKPAMGKALVRIEQQYGRECRTYLTQIAEDMMAGTRIRVCADHRIRKIFGTYR